MNKLLQSFLYFVLLFLSSVALSQQSQVTPPQLEHSTGGVLIKDETALNQPTGPNPSAMLDVSSTSKGILIPRVDYSKIDPATPVQNRIIPSDGLMVYVVSSSVLTNIGFWIYDASKSQWRKLFAATNPERSSIPEGTIIMYSGGIDKFDNKEGALIGKKGTDMEGWSLCNGKGGTPDLQGMFIVGWEQPDGNSVLQTSTNTGDYNKVGNTMDTENANKLPKFKLDLKNIPSHNHVIANNVSVPFAHTHALIEDPIHTHTYSSSTKPSANGGMIRRRQAVKETKQQEYTTSTSSYTIEISNQVADTKISIAEPLKMIENKGENNEVDIRPRYYVLAYIMRTNGNFDGNPNED